MWLWGQTSLVLVHSWILLAGVQHVTPPLTIPYRLMQTPMDRCTGGGYYRKEGVGSYRRERRGLLHNSQFHS